MDDAEEMISLGTEQQFVICFGEDFERAAGRIVDVCQKADRCADC